ncbi:VanZ family protein [Candidatus Desantisbacteria bacterium]|nr:VanZ family protein [Candidatus Desantisbacteria bacterium]
MKKILYFWGPVVFLFSFIFILSSFSTLPQPVIIPDFDKIEHLIAYLVISLTVYRALLGTTVYSEKKCIKLAILTTVIYGMSDEFHQSFVPYRDASLGDLFFDFIGAVLAYGSLFNEVRKGILNDGRMSKM